jgi:hypothetical protein
MKFLTYLIVMMLRTEMILEDVDYEMMLILADN